MKAKDNGTPAEKRNSVYCPIETPFQMPVEFSFETLASKRKWQNIFSSGKRKKEFVNDKNCISDKTTSGMNET